ncbi:hypothetical protein CGK74_14560 [Thauera propionica]|uniref:Uncharacterized protein n=1 Tax=Thauera propionica TaxID=2019431 RepID=A0A235EVJ4_9RHOO|nr:hypothetical protein [Thauera propionica]OYD53066.1 hypothetical protein CGK74_14560 [Thauera propionica]
MTISTRVENIPNAPRFSGNPAIQAEAAKAYQSAFVEAALAERRRCAAIMNLKEGAGREAMQYQLMSSTTLSPEEVREMLAAVPAVQHQVRNVFAAAMAAIGNPPTMGLDGNADDPVDRAAMEEAAAQAILKQSGTAAK